MTANYDLEQLEGDTIKENDLVLYGVPGVDEPRYLPIRVLGRSATGFIYDSVVEGMNSVAILGTTSSDGISSPQFVNFAQFSSSKINGKPTDIFDLTKRPDLIYQMFVGITPTNIQLYIQQPFGTNQRALPTIGYTSAYLQQGWIDADLSPFFAPTKASELHILPGLSIAGAFSNKSPETSSPLLFFWINALKVGVVTDPELAWQMVTDTVPKKEVKKKTVGGLQAVSYDPSVYYKIKGIKLSDLNKSEAKARAAVAEAVAPTR